MSDVHRDLIVTSEWVDLAREVAGAWEAGRGMFLSPLASESDPATVTHYISTGKIGADVAAMLDDPATFTAEINRLLGASYTEAEIQALRDSMDISTDGPQSAMSRLGLVMQTMDAI